MPQEEETRKLGQAVLYCVYCKRRTNFDVAYHIDRRSYVCCECKKSPPKTVDICPRCGETSEMIQIEEWDIERGYKWAYHMCTRRGCGHRVLLRLPLQEEEE